MPENRRMTEDELTGYDGAVDGFVLDSEEFLSRLYVSKPIDSAQREVATRWYLYGDLRPAFEVDDSYEEDEHGEFGNHRVSRILRDGGVDLDGIDLDPEGATFFAYAETRERATKLAKDINALSAERRQA